jgi:Na+-driven multidrug efflux pump
MNEMLHDFCRFFWICLAVSLALAALSYILIWRKHRWLRFLDAEESFWFRFGLPKGGFGRRFGESRFFAISFVVFSLVWLLLAVVSAVLYFYFLHRLQR